MLWLFGILLVFDIINRCIKEIGITVSALKASTLISKLIPHIEKNLMCRRHFGPMKLQPLLILFVKHLVFFLAFQFFYLLIVLIVVVAELLVFQVLVLMLFTYHLNFYFWLNGSLIWNLRFGHSIRVNVFIDVLGSWFDFLNDCFIRFRIIIEKVVILNNLIGYLHELWDRRFRKRIRTRWPFYMSWRILLNISHLLATIIDLVLIKEIQIINGVIIRAKLSLVRLNAAFKESFMFRGKALFLLKSFSFFVVLETWVLIKRSLINFWGWILLNE